MYILKTHVSKTYFVPGFTLFGEFDVKTNCEVYDGEIAWLDHLIYVTYEGISTIRVFEDHPPFNELSERIVIDEWAKPYSMVASPANRSLYVSDYYTDCIWKIQMPGKEVSRWTIEGARGDCLSITPNGELLVVLDVFADDEEDEWREGENGAVEDPGRIESGRYINIFNLADFSRTKSIHLPELDHSHVIKFVAQLPDGNFVVLHSMYFADNSLYQYTEHYEMSILSNDDECSLLHTFDPLVFPMVEHRDYWSPRHLSITGDGYIFVADEYNDRVLLLDSHLNTNDYKVVWSEKFQPQKPTKVVYRQDRLLVLWKHDDNPRRR